MRIGEACELTGLTKKAIRYYESKQLISPEIDENGYRNYSDEVIQQLVLIAVLRAFSLSIEQIRESLKGEEALTDELRRTIDLYKREQDRLSLHVELLHEFLRGRHSMQEIGELRVRLESAFHDCPGYLGRKLRDLFPGEFGEVIAAIWGRMLDQKLETPGQRAAWVALVSDLDALAPIEVPEEITEWARERNHENEITDNLDRLTDEYSQDYEEYASLKRAAAERYLAETPEEERRKQLERTRLISSFLTGAGLQVSLAIGKHLPELSRKMTDFGEKGQRFIRENSELIDRMMEAKQ